MRDLLEDVNLGMDVLLKTFSILFTLCVAGGAILIARYFSSIGLGGEIVGLLSSPTTLFSIAIYALGISLFFMLVLIVVPAALRFVFGSQLHWKETNIRHKFWYVFGGILLAMLAFLGLAALDIKGGGSPLFFLCLSMVYSMIVFRICEGINEPTVKKELSVRFTVTFILFVCLIMLVFVMMPFISVISGHGLPDWLQYLALTGLILVYTFCVALSIQSESLAGYLPMGFFGLILVVFMLSGSLTKNIIVNIGLGGYQTNISLKKEFLAELPNDFTSRPSANSDEITVLESVWVAASLPSKLVLSNSKDMEMKYVIPSSSVLSEW